MILSPFASNYKISDAGDFTFRIYPSDAQQGVLDAEVAWSLGYRRAAILHVFSDYGIGLRDVFQDRFTELGGEIVAVESYEEGETNFRTRLTKIDNAGAELIFMPGNEREMGRILSQAKQLGLDQQFFATDSFLASSIIENAGAAANGVIFSTLAENRDSVWIDFSEAYRNRFSSEPGLLEALGYDAVQVMVAAFQEGARTGTQLKDTLYELPELSGTTGAIKFDSNGDVDKEFVVKQVVDGEFVDFDAP